MQRRRNVKIGLSLCLAISGSMALALAQDKPAIVKDFESKGGQPIKVKAAPKSSHVIAEVQTTPSVQASIFHGKKRLGKAPLRKKFKRDSGPVDIVIRADGFFPVNTRIFTHTDSKFVIKLTPLEEANTLFGYKEEIPPDAGVGEIDGSLPTPDAGVSTPNLPGSSAPSQPSTP